MLGDFEKDVDRILRKGWVLEKEDGKGVNGIYRGLSI